MIKGNESLAGKGPGGPCEGDAGPGLYSRWNLQALFQASHPKAGMHTTKGVKVPFYIACEVGAPGHHAHSRDDA